MSDGVMYGVIGKAGSGKTTFLTAAAYHSNHGKTFMGIPPHSTVFSTFACSGCYKLDFQQLGRVCITDSLILIDEIATLADNRDWKNFGSDLVYFFSHFRHFGCDVIWCSQYWDADKKIDVRTDRLFMLERSAFFPVSWVKPIVHTLDIIDGRRVDEYSKAPPISWKPIWRPRYYSGFDSFCKRDLPPPTLELWDPSPDPSPDPDPSPSPDSKGL